MKKTVLFSLFASVMVLSFLCLSANAQDKKADAGNYTIEVKKVEAIKALVIKVTVPTNEIGPKMGELYGKLFAYLGQKQIQPSGAPFAVYYTFDPKGNTTFEAGVPISGNIKSDGEIQFKEYPAMEAVYALFTGAYEKMVPVYTAMEKYMKDKGLQSTGVSWEVYLTDPKTLKNPDDNQTIIYFPVK